MTPERARAILERYQRELSAEAARRKKLAPDLLALPTERQVELATGIERIIVAAGMQIKRLAA